MWHTLALALGGRSVSEWKRSMSAAEFVRWCSYYRQSPFDDRHRYMRPAALIAAGVYRSKKGPEYFLDYLQPRESSYSSVDESVFRAFGVKKR